MVANFMLHGKGILAFSPFQEKDRTLYKRLA